MTRIRSSELVHVSGVVSGIQVPDTIAIFLVSILITNPTHILNLLLDFYQMSELVNGAGLLRPVAIASETALATACDVPGGEDALDVPVLIYLS